MFRGQERKDPAGEPDLKSLYDIWAKTGEIKDNQQVLSVGPGLTVGVGAKTQELTRPSVARRLGRHR